jgi:hypothetical protein
MEETDSLSWTGSIIVGGETAYYSTPSFDMRKVAGTKHGFDNGGSVDSVTSFSGGNGEEAEGIGVETVELGFITEAREDGLSARERRGSVVVRKLRE